MVRPKKKRFVSAPPPIEEFVPKDMEVTGEIFLSVEEFEAVRLSDFEKRDQESAAVFMGISRHTFGRLLATARSKIAQALVEGKSLKIVGGHYEFCEGGPRRRWRRGGGRGGR